MQPPRASRRPSSRSVSSERRRSCTDTDSMRSCVRRRRNVRYFTGFDTQCRENRFTSGCRGLSGGEQNHGLWTNRNTTNVRALLRPQHPSRWLTGDTSTAKRRQHPQGSRCSGRFSQTKVRNNVWSQAPWEIMTLRAVVSYEDAQRSSDEPSWKGDHEYGGS
jgi:hypothetical protein